MEVSWGVLQFYLDRGHFGPSLKNLTRLKQKLTVTAGKSDGSAISISLSLIISLFLSLSLSLLLLKQAMIVWSVNY